LFFRIMERYLEGIIDQARALQKRMAVFQSLSEPLYGLLMGVSHFEFRPEEHSAVVVLAIISNKANEYATMEDYWSDVCHTLASRADPGQKAKALLAFDRAINVYYFRNMTPEQNEVYQQVKGILRALVSKAPKPPRLVSTSRNPNSPVDEKRDARNALALENMLFLDPAEVERFYDFCARYPKKFGEGVYTTVLRNIAISFVD